MRLTTAQLARAIERNLIEALDWERLAVAFTTWDDDYAAHCRNRAEQALDRAVTYEIRIEKGTA